MIGNQEWIRKVAIPPVRARAYQSRDKAWFRLPEGIEETKQDTNETIEESDDQLETEGAIK